MQMGKTTRWVLCSRVALIGVARWDTQISGAPIKFPSQMGWQLYSPLGSLVN